MTCRRGLSVSLFRGVYHHHNKAYEAHSPQRYGKGRSVAYDAQILQKVGNREQHAGYGSQYAQALDVLLPRTVQVLVLIQLALARYGGIYEVHAYYKAEQCKYIASQ